MLYFIKDLNYITILLSVLYVSLYSCQNNYYYKIEHAL
jgi:hypothetical protein